MKKHLVLLLILPMVFALESQPPPLLPLEAEGICHDFILRLDIREDIYWDFLASGCWDIKIDTPGKIMVNNEWQDNFFYANSAMCNGTTELNVNFESSSDVAPIIKFRQGDKIYQRTASIVQNCPKPISNTMLLLFVSAIILVMMTGMWWYRR